MKAKITATTAYKNLKEPLKQRFLLKKENRMKIEHGVIVAKNRGFEYYDLNYSVQAIVKEVVREIYEKEKFPNVIDNWLEKNGDPEIEEEVIAEIEQLIKEL